RRAQRKACCPRSLPIIVLVGAALCGLTASEEASRWHLVRCAAHLFLVTGTVVSPTQLRESRTRSLPFSCSLPIDRLCIWRARPSTSPRQVSARPEAGR